MISPPARVGTKCTKEYGVAESCVDVRHVERPALCTDITKRPVSCTTEAERPVLYTDKGAPGVNRRLWGAHHTSCWKELKGLTLGCIGSIFIKQDGYLEIQSSYRLSAITCLEGADTKALIVFL
eukprot:scaffold270543_cov19-Tisochrysis_lutea.AAC.1